MEDVLDWQEQWVHPEAYGFHPHTGAIDAATVLSLLVELAQVMGTPQVGGGTDNTKCFDLIPQAISMAVLEVRGINVGVLRAFRGMYSQPRRMLKIKGCLGAWWAATNGILQGCPLSVVVINAMATTWKRIIDDLRVPVTVTTKEMPPRPKEEVIPSCYWASYGAGLDHIWVWRCVRPCCCWEMGWIVDRVHGPPPNLDQGGARTPPPPATEGLPRWEPHEGSEGMGEAGTAGNAYPSEHGTLQGVPTGSTIAGDGVPGPRGGTPVTHPAEEPFRIGGRKR